MEAKLPEIMTCEAVLSELRPIKAELIKRYAIDRLGIFGSVARQEATPDSDIDIVVHMQPNLLKRACLKTELENIFGRKVDVIRYWSGMNPFLKKRIDQEAVYV